MSRNKILIRGRATEKTQKMKRRILHLPIIKRFFSMMGITAMMMITALFILVANEGRCFGNGAMKHADRQKENTSIEDYQVKMVFIEKLTRFVHWPDNSSVRDTTKPFTIGFIGQIRHKRKAIELLTKNVKEIKGKPVNVCIISEKEEILKCDMLLIASSEKNKLSSIIETVKDKPILTVSDADGVAQKGVHINYMINRKGLYEFVLNEGALIDSQLDVRHQLKRYAKKIVNKQRRRNTR
jgi:hypothetical protein